jgi:SMI1 / KNR4 family (SUKH-1)
VTDTITRLAGRVVSDLHSVGPVGVEFTAAPKATLELVLEAEKQLGFALPPLLRRAYLEVANGGFGPGYGVMGIWDGFTDDQSNTVVDLYQSYRRGYPDDPTWDWPRGLLPICHWGCAVYSAVDATTEGNPVVFMDIGVKDAGAPMSSITIPHKSTLQSWLEDWLEGKDLWSEVWG